MLGVSVVRLIVKAGSSMARVESKGSVGWLAGLIMGGIEESVFPLLERCITMNASSLDGLVDCWAGREEVLSSLLGGYI